MNAGDALLLNYIGRTKISDGRAVVVYDDGEYRHAVEAGHWDDCGFGPTNDGEQRVTNFDCWNAVRRHWVDDHAAVEAARSLGLDFVHSAENGCCSRLAVEPPPVASGQVLFVVSERGFDINCARLESEPSKATKMVTFKGRSRPVAVSSAQCHDTLDDAKAALLTTLQAIAKSIAELEYDEENFWVA
jgi:hypothetical protein